MSGERSALRSRPLIALLTAEGISSLGSQMTFLALPWFVLVTTGSAAKMSIVLAVEILPIALLGIPSGALVARLGARTTMVLGDAGRAPLMLAIPILHEAGLLSFPLLLAGPIGLVIVGPLLASWGPRPVLLFVALGQFLATLPFAFYALRRGREEASVTLEAA